MKTRSLVFGLMVCLTAIATVAKAQVTLDVTKITCGQFAAYKITNPKYIAVWVSGYYHAPAKRWSLTRSNWWRTPTSW